MTAVGVKQGDAPEQGVQPVDFALQRSRSLRSISPGVSSPGSRRSWFSSHRLPVYF